MKAITHTTTQKIASLVILVCYGWSHCSNAGDRLPARLPEYDYLGRYIDVEIESATKYPKFVIVPSGTVTIGIPQSLKQLRSRLERRHHLFFRERTFTPLEELIEKYTPTRIKEISTFKVTKYEVSLADFKRYRDATGNPFSHALLPAIARTTLASQGKLSNHDRFSELPACWISYEDALSYCKWLTKEIGSTCRLPSESEWEYMAKTSHGYLFPTGETLPENDCHIRFGPRENCGTNDFGIYGLSCNVREWCQMDMSNQPSSEMQEKDILTHVSRGGFFLFDVSGYTPEIYLSAMRFKSNGSATVETGFRVVQESE